MIIRDKYPLTKHHILVLSKRHIENARCLTSTDADLIERMNEHGRNIMTELGADLTDMRWALLEVKKYYNYKIKKNTQFMSIIVHNLRSGFNWPPANTIPHLHQHFISPGSSLSFFRSLMFSSSNMFFVSVRYCLYLLIIICSLF